MSTTYVNSESNTGTTTATAAAGPGVVWNLTSLIISQSGPTIGPNAKVTIYDGAVGGTVLYKASLSGPGHGYGGSLALGGSVGVIQEIPLPRDALGRPCLQSSPGNAMTIQVIGTGVNLVNVNARFTDGLP